MVIRRYDKLTLVSRVRQMNLQSPRLRFAAHIRPLRCHMIILTMPPECKVYANSFPIFRVLVLYDIPPITCACVRILSMVYHLTRGSDHT